MSKNKNKEKKNIAPNPASKGTSSDTSIIETQIYQSGPLPPAEQLDKYNQFVPGAGDRIIKMAEEGFKHGREMEKETLKAIRQEKQRGQWMAFTMGLVGLAGAFYLGLKGQGYPSIGLGLLGIIVITAQVVMNRTRK